MYIWKLRFQTGLESKPIFDFKFWSLSQDVTQKDNKLRFLRHYLTESGATSTRKDAKIASTYKKQKSNLYIG